LQNFVKSLVIFTDFLPIFTNLYKNFQHCLVNVTDMYQKFAAVNCKKSFTVKYFFLMLP